jgi:hypothetical protein
LFWAFYFGPLLKYLENMALILEGVDDSCSRHTNKSFHHFGSSKHKLSQPQTSNTIDVRSHMKKTPQVCIDVNVPRHCSPQHSSKSSEGDNGAKQSTDISNAEDDYAVKDNVIATTPVKRPASNVIINKVRSSLKVSVPTPSRRRERQATRGEVIFNFETGSMQRIAPVASTVSDILQKHTTNKCQPHMISGFKETISHGPLNEYGISSDQGLGLDQPPQMQMSPHCDKPDGRRGCLRYLLQQYHLKSSDEQKKQDNNNKARMLKKTPEKSRAKTDEDVVTPRNASRDRILKAAVNVSHPLPFDDERIEERRNNAVQWRGQRVASDEYSMVLRHRVMNGISFSWQRCTHCGFQFLSSSHAELHSSDVYDARINTGSSDLQDEAQKSGNFDDNTSRHMSVKSLDFYSVDDIDDSILDDEHFGMPDFTKSKCCSMECYWSSVYQMNERYH